MGIQNCDIEKHIGHWMLSEIQSLDIIGYSHLGKMASANNVTKADLTELKALKSPPAQVADVVACLVILLNNTTNDKPITWKEGQKLLGDMDILKRMIEFDGTKVSDEQKKKLNVRMGQISIEEIMEKSRAGAGLFQWCLQYC